MFEPKLWLNFFQGKPNNVACCSSMFLAEANRWLFEESLSHLRLKRLDSPQPGVCLWLGPAKRRSRWWWRPYEQRSKTKSWVCVMCPEKQTPKHPPTHRTSAGRKREGAPLLFLFGEASQAVGGKAKKAELPLAEVQTRFVPSQAFLGGRVPRSTKRFLRIPGLGASGARDAGREKRNDPGMSDPVACGFL